MPTFNAKKFIASLFTLYILVISLGSINGFVLCCGQDDHMHIETTFNGVDCGHFPPSPLQATRDSHYLAADSSPAPTPCYACTDIPLASPQYLLQKKYGTANTYSRKIIGTAADLVSSFCSLTTRANPSDQSTVQPVNSHCTLNQLFSSVLRI